MSGGATSGPFGAFDPDAAAHELYPAGYGDLPLDADIGAASARSPLASSLLCVVALGGGIGTVARYGVGRVFPTSSGTFPVTLLVINTLGALLVGVVVTLFVHRLAQHNHARLFLTTGILGGWTTYSAVIGSILVLGHDQHLGLAGLFVLLSFAFGIAAAWAGIGLGTALWPQESS